MLVPKTPDSRKDPPIITENPTVYDYTQSQATSSAVSQQEDGWMSLDNPTTSANALLSGPSVHNILSLPTLSNTVPSNEQTISRETMPEYLLRDLRKKKCNVATRQFLFENPENILPFQISYPQDYPQEILGANTTNQKLEKRLNWVRNSLTKNALGEFRAPSCQHHFENLF